MLKRLSFSAIFYSCFSCAIILKVFAYFMNSNSQSTILFKDSIQYILYFLIIILAIQEFVYFYKALEEKGRNIGTMIKPGIRFVVISLSCLLFWFLNTIF